MATKGTSKYISLKKLIEIRDNGYRGEHCRRTGKVKDYDKIELDEMIRVKTAAKMDALSDSNLKDRETLGEIQRDSLRQIVGVLARHGDIVLEENDLRAITTILADYVADHI